MRLNSHLAAQCLDRLLGHWLWAAVIILVAAALTIPQLDRLALSPDGRRQYIQSFGIGEETFSAGEVLAAVRHQSPAQAPLSHLLLHYWGNAVGHSLAAARLFFVFAGLMSLAMVYRLARDFASPEIGTLAVFILLCHAMYAFYFAYVRYYSLVVLLAAIILWLYLRLVSHRNPPPWRIYLALAISCCALVSTHVFGFVLYATLSLYHLLAVRKNWRWLKVVATALAGLVLASWVILPTLTVGVSSAIDRNASRADEIGELLAQWVTVNSNGSPLLFAFVTMGAFVGWKRGYLRGSGANPFALLAPLFVVGITLASAVTGVVGTGKMRYFLVGTPILVSFFACGCYALYRLRRWLGLLALFMWLATGLYFNSTANWYGVIEGVTKSFTNPAWHQISRWMQQSGEKLPVMSFGIWHEPILVNDPLVPGDLKKYYFGQHGIPLIQLSRNQPSQRQFSDHLQWDLHDRPSFRVIYQTSQPHHAAVAALETTAEQYNYQLCETTTFPISTVVLTYRWEILQCEPPKPHSVFETSIGDFTYYGAIHDLEGDKLLISGERFPTAGHNMADVNLSYQLLDDEWKNMAQLDLPLYGIDGLRRFSIDLADVPAGDYRLMAVVYDAQTGVRHAWQDNEGWIPEMQQLEEIAIPERAATSS